MDIARTLNAGVYLKPRGELMVLEAPQFGTEVMATPYLLGVLDMFSVKGGRSGDEVMSEILVQKKTTRAFIEECIAKGILIDIDEDGSTLPLCRVPQQTFADVPSITESVAPFVFLGIPWDRSTTGHPGARFGPQAIRASSLAMRYSIDRQTKASLGFYDFNTESLLLEGINLTDGGDVLANPGEREKIIFDRVTFATADILARGAIPLIMGGDHSMTFATVSAFAGEIAILHLDAHTDMGALSPEGNVHHGSFLTGLLQTASPHINKVVQVGLRGIYDISARVSDKRVTQIGMRRSEKLAVQDIIDMLPKDLPLYISVDIDCLDPAYAPSTGTPVAGGMKPSHVIEIVRAAGEQRNVVAVDVMEVAAPKGPGDMTAMIACEVLIHAADAIVCGMRERLLSEES